jgi:hypothetical protein
LAKGTIPAPSSASASLSSSASASAPSGLDLPFIVRATVEDTGGVITPLNVQVKSLEYSSQDNTNATDCNPIQFMFYNELGKLSGVTYITPGEIGVRCVDFHGSTVVSYNGVTMLIPVPDGDGLSVVEK